MAFQIIDKTHIYMYMYTYVLAYKYISVWIQMREFSESLNREGLMLYAWKETWDLGGQKGKSIHSIDWNHKIEIRMSYSFIATKNQNKTQADRTWLRVFEKNNSEL